MGVRPFPAARLVDIAQRALVTPFPASLAAASLRGGADGIGSVRLLPLAARKNGTGSNWMCWTVRAVGTALTGLPLWGALRFLESIVWSHSVSFLYSVRAVWAGAVPPPGRAVTLGKKGKQCFATVRSSPWADLHCALQPQFSFHFFQLEAGQPPAVLAQLPDPGYPV